MNFDLRHALAVASWVDPEDKLVALFHDAIEDGAVSAADLVAAGFPAEVVGAVQILTRRSGERYSDYIARVAQDERARRVKIADLRANLGRMDSEHESLRSRYEKALAVLSP